MTAKNRVRSPLPETALKPALTLALALEHAPMGVLLLRNETTGSLELLATEGMTDEQSSQFGPQRPGVGPVGVAFAEHRRVTVRDILLDGDADGGAVLRDIARGIGFRGLDVVPVTQQDGTAIGAFAALFPVARQPSARSARLVELCGRIVAISIENARLRTDAEHRRAIVEALARARVQFVARMSHELRTPLQSITGYIDLLRLGNDGPLTPRQRHMLDRVYESEKILINVIDDLADMARLEAGGLKYDIADVVATDAMAAAADVVQPLADKKGVVIDVCRDPPTLVVKADDAKLRQIFVNLLANAVKFTARGGTVRMTCTEDHDFIVFDVSDTGSGIPANKLANVFRPFVQLGNSSTPSADGGLAGSGLGLAISLEFARGMGGTLTVKSTVGRGSVFTLRLPRSHLGPIAPAT